MPRPPVRRPIYCTYCSQVSLFNVHNVTLSTYIFINICSPVISVIPVHNYVSTCSCHKKSFPYYHVFALPNDKGTLLLPSVICFDGITLSNCCLQIFCTGTRPVCCLDRLYDALYTVRNVTAYVSLMYIILHCRPIFLSIYVLLYLVSSLSLIVSVC